jgi:hypothetical protein
MGPSNSRNYAHKLIINYISLLMYGPSNSGNYAQTSSISYTYRYILYIYV